MKIVCAAPGPSLCAADLESVRSCCRVLCIGDAWRLAPWAYWLYHADARWWDFHAAEVMEAFPGEKWMPVRYFDAAGAETDIRCVLRHGLKFKPVRHPDYNGLGDDPFLHHGMNSGYQAINLAKHFGATTVILLGYDMAGGHFFGEHPPEIRRQTNWEDLRERMATIKGLNIVNCSRETSLTCFPRMTLEDAINAA